MALRRRYPTLLILPAIAFLATAGASLTCPGSAAAGKKDDTLRWSSNIGIENVDAYFNNVREGVVVARLIWDQLLWRNPKTGKYEPMLAKSYHWVNATAIDFELRQGITFHNGEKFDADDVVFTLNYVSDPANKAITQANVNWIKNAEKLGPYTVRIHLKAPFPAALEYLAGPIPIYPNEYYAKVGPKGMGEKPVGTGPYMVTEVQPGSLLRFAKNPNYFKDSPQGQPSIGKLELRIIPETNTQIAELMTSGIDWIWRVPPDQMESLKGVPDLTVSASETMRVGYLQMDVTGRIPNLPVAKKQVRQAIAYAINRESIRTNLVGGSARVVASPCFPEQFGCVTEGVKTYRYDPAQAKKFLAEAGYPNGFAIDLFAYAPTDRPYVEAIIGDLRAVGITANLHFMQYAAARDELRAGHAPLFYGSWGSFSIGDVSAFTGNFFKFAADDTSRDPMVRDWLQTADTHPDAKVRLDNYGKALRRIAEEAYWLPAFTYSLNYAFTKDLNFSPDVDEIPRFVNARWK